ncbi:MAG TPA: formyltransferase family protein [Candidatus Paceibacterota bacterium]|jgi:phosphoribosylglycinamide formyltransferase-1|nr:formyltransferase family protein [Candidatus Paceibacterota bacterium]
MKIALLISGGGTTMQAIIKACKDNALQGVVPALVIASKEGIGGIQKALDLGIKEKDILVLNPKAFADNSLYGEAILAECKKRNVDFIGQYGWLVKTPSNVIEAYKNMIINQHPGPLDTGRPDFGGVGMYGMRVHQARLEFVRRTNKDFWTEATAHRVTVDFDEGKIVKRKQVPIFQNDTAEILQARVLPIEHEVQIETLRDFANGNVSEFIRETPLVLPSEEKILEECKQLAIKMYPKG